MSAYGPDPVQTYTRTETETRTVVVDVPTQQLGEYMQQRIDQLQRERDYYRSGSDGFLAAAIMLQRALKRLNPNAPELSKEFLGREYHLGVTKKLTDDNKATLISTAPTLAELGLGPDGKPKQPGQIDDAGGLIGGLKKLFG